jgi:hypothetical protein
VCVAHRSTGATLEGKEMKSICRKGSHTRHKVATREKFAMTKEWAEFLHFKRTQNCLLALFSVIALMGLAVITWIALAGSGGVGVCIATATIVSCVGRVLNTIFKSTNQTRITR